jgi:2-keto-3-deoxy-L-rhamnonate aldolase RhmA
MMAGSTQPKDKAMPTQTSKPGLRERVARRELMRGSFVKSADPSSIEIFGAAGLDFVVIDQEHGIFDRATLNVALLAARAAAIPAVVRVSHLAPEVILSALDNGAAGILAPHVATADDARALVRACRYRTGSRGFSGVTRAGGYGSKPMWEHIDASDAGIAAIAMIEDPSALDALEEILAVEGLDAVFIGRGDLTVAFGAPNRNDAIITEAVDRILDAARAYSKPVWVMVDSAADAEAFLARGAVSFIVSSDQGLLRKAAAEIAGKLHFSGNEKTA